MLYLGEISSALCKTITIVFKSVGKDTEYCARSIKLGNNYPKKWNAGT